MGGRRGVWGYEGSGVWGEGGRGVGGEGRGCRR